MIYQVWRLDCECGHMEDFGEDAASLPDKCPECMYPTDEKADLIDD